MGGMLIGKSDGAIPKCDHFQMCREGCWVIAQQDAFEGGRLFFAKAPEKFPAVARLQRGVDGAGGLPETPGTAEIVDALPYEKADIGMLFL